MRQLGQNYTQTAIGPEGAGKARDGEGEVPKEAGRYSQSLSHGLAILASFSAETATQGIADMAGALHMTRSTTHRYATTLAQLGYLEQNTSRRYRLTPRAADVGLAAVHSLVLYRSSLDLLHDLREQTGRTVSLGILDGTELMLVYRVRGWRGLHEIDLRLGPAARLPLHCTAMGKVLLAGLPEIRLRALLSASTLSRRGPNCITGKRALRSELEWVRSQGFAIDNEELTKGLCSIAVPVPAEEGGALAAIDIAVAAETLAEEELNTAFGTVLGRAADGIAEAMAV